MRFVETDGGRVSAGYKGFTGDCVVRSIAIATGVPYEQVYKDLHALTKAHRPTMAHLTLKHGPVQANRRASPRYGVWPKVYKAYLWTLGWEWTPTMGIGTGCQVHLKDGELPMGNLVVRLSKHVTAVIDGVIHDNHDPSRGGTRCVYGYFEKG